MNVHTSEKDWFSKVAKAYKDKLPLVIIDDAGTGFNPENALLKNIIRVGLSPDQIYGALIAVNMSAIGAGMVILAVLDPDPTSKLGLMVGAGALLVFTGGVTGIYVITGTKPPKIHISKDEKGNVAFDIGWE